MRTVLMVLLLLVALFALLCVMGGIIGTVLSLARRSSPRVALSVVGVFGVFFLIASCGAIIAAPAPEAELPYRPEKPVHTVRMGNIRAAIWSNVTPNRVWYNVTFSRLYKEGDDWKSSDHFGRDDLLVLAKVADRVHSWIYLQQQQSY